MSGVKRAAGGGRKRNSVVKSGQKNKKNEIKVIAPPDELIDSAAKSMWKMQSGILIERGTFEPEHAPLLLAYCNSFSLLLMAENRITLEGLVVESDTGGPKKHPAVNVRNDCVSQIARLGSLLCLDPLSNARAVGGNNEKKSNIENEFDEF